MSSDLVTQNFALLYDRNSPEGTLRIVWTGRLIEREADEVLMPYFNQLASEAVERNLLLLFDFTELLHFNSATIAALMRLIQSLRNSKVRLTLHYDASKKWQRLTFAALRHLRGPEGLIVFSTINAPPSTSS